MQVVGNDELFFGEPSYFQQLVAISSSILQNLVEAIQQEPLNVCELSFYFSFLSEDTIGTPNYIGNDNDCNQVARGNMALEACNCIISSFEVGSLQ